MKCDLATPVPQLYWTNIIHKDDDALVHEQSYYESFFCVLGERHELHRVPSCFLLCSLYTDDSFLSTTFPLYVRNTVI